jgi:DNA-binding MarR family transcriptional regulator
MNVGNLADALAVHQSTATRLCDRLVARGLVDRKPSAQSRREVVLSLTRSGQALIRSVTDRRRAEIDAAMAKLSATQRAAITDAFTTFAEAAGEAPDDAWKLGWTT